MKKKTICVFSVVTVLLSFLLLPAAPVAAQAPECCPALKYASATVDGNPAEWAEDLVFSDLCRAGNPLKPVEACLRLRYDCRTNVMYALVLSKDVMPVEQDLEEAWVKVDYSPAPVTFSAFAWVMKGAVAVGWEASFPLSQGKHWLKVHANVYDGGWQTAATTWVCVLVYCPPTAVTLAGFSVTPGRGGILVSWETASEINNLGFNIYRSQGENVRWATKINVALIPAANLGSLIGGSYSYLDKSAKAGVRYHYWLGDVETTGTNNFNDLGWCQWNPPVVDSNFWPRNGGQSYATGQNFTATFLDWDGDLAKVQLLIGASPTASKKIEASYNRRTRKFSLKGGSYATLLLAGCRVVLDDGKTLRVAWSLKFTQGFRGTYNLYLKAEDAPGNATVWRLMGSWIVR